MIPICCIIQLTGLVHGSRSHLDKNDIVKTSRVERVRDLEAPLNLVNLDTSDKDCMNGQMGRSIGSLGRVPAKPVCGSENGTNFVYVTLPPRESMTQKATRT